MTRAIGLGTYLHGMSAVKLTSGLFMCEAVTPVARRRGADEVPWIL